MTPIKVEEIVGRLNEYARQFQPRTRHIPAVAREQG